MAFGNFGSAWREKAFYTDPDQRLHVADPAHAEKSVDPNIVWDAPEQIEQGLPDFLYDVQADDWVADNAGLVVNTTPVDHQDGGDFEATPFGPETTRANYASASRSFGAERQDNYQPPLIQDFTTSYQDRRFEGLGATDVAPVALVRGLNSNASNNPDGFRRGWVEQSFVDRKFQIGERTHDRRLLTPNTAYVAADQPPVAGTSGNPFTGLARAFTSISQQPMIRREPVSMSDSITTDGSDQPIVYDDQAGDWVAG